MEGIHQYQNYQVAYKLPKIISTKALAQKLFIEERSMCFVSGYYLKPYMNNEVKIIDCSTGGEDAHNAFLAESIPTSVYLNTSVDLVDGETSYPNGYPTKEEVIAAMQKLGMTTSDIIILYCQPDKISSMTRVFHILNSYGFSDVTILDGDIKKFKIDGYPTTPGIDYTGPESEIKDLADPTPYLSKMDEIVEFALGKRPNMQLIDMRGEESFNGHDPNLPEGCRQGHVPGAINISADIFTNEDNTFKKYYELLEIFKSHGVNPEKELVCMCKTGMSATVGYMALVFANFSGMKLYDGSWTEYGANDTPSTVAAPSFPMYYQPGMNQAPQYVLVPTNFQYAPIPDQKDHFPVYQK